MAPNISKLIPVVKYSFGQKNYSVLQCISGRSSSGLKSFRNDIHSSLSRPFPKAALLPLPDNVQDINDAETACFSPLRSRDLSGSVIVSLNHQESVKSMKIDVTLDSDPHIGSYDCRGAVSLSSSMQSNVPSPFGGESSILSMPGSQWGQGYKYLSDHLHSSHYLTLRNSYKDAANGIRPKTGTIRSYHTFAMIPDYRCNFLSTGNTYVVVGNKNCVRTFSDETAKPTENNKPVSRKEKLKQAVAAYGSTVIIFHVTISLASLGICYLLVSSGLDVTAWIEYLGLTDSAFSKKVATNTGTFVVAYAVHKVFAPARIGITLTATPFIVKYLRKIGMLKTPKK